MKSIVQKKSKIAVTIALAASLFIVQSPQALIPTTDIANLTENIMGNLQKMQSWVEEKGLMKFTMKQAGVNTELEIDAMNNGLANVIFRTGRANQEIQNIEILEKSAPDKDACNTITSQVLLKDANCGASSTVKERVMESTKKHANFKQTPAEQERSANALVKRKIGVCENLSDGASDPSNTLNSTMCTRANLIVAGGTGDTLSGNEEQAVDEYIDLITGTVPTLKKSAAYDGATEEQEHILVEELRREAFRATVNTSLNEIAATVKSPDGNSPSVLQSLQLFVDERFGSEKWAATLGNVHETEKNSVYTSEIIRKVAAMDAFLIQMSMLQYRQQLRMEMLLAAQLAYDIDPPK